MTTLVENKKVRLNYELLEEFEAGIELLGFEVKSLRNKKGTLDGAHAVVRGGEAFLVGMHIPPYQPANTPEGYDPERPRRLLLKRDELRELVGTEKQKGLTLVPIRVYTKGPNIKISIGIARGKKKQDKREHIKKRDIEREIGRTLKG